jgi:hypothetical protein
LIQNPARRADATDSSISSHYPSIPARPRKVVEQCGDAGCLIRSHAEAEGARRILAELEQVQLVQVDQRISRAPTERAAQDEGHSAHTRRS